MESSDIISQESQHKDWDSGISNLSVDYDKFIQTPIDFDGYYNDNDSSEYMSNFLIKAPKIIFKVTSDHPVTEPFHCCHDSISTGYCSCLPLNEHKISGCNSISTPEIPRTSKIQQINDQRDKSMTISERMKLKTEKTKLMLEKKTKKDEILTNQQDTTIAINEEEEEEMNHPTYNESIQNSKTMNEIISKKTKRDSITSEDIILQMNNEKSLTKKEIKMLKNRVSAQRSRDRKKKEFDELQSYTLNLQNENNQLQSELDRRDKEMEFIKSKIMSLCGNCKDSFSFLNVKCNENMTKPELSQQEFRITDNNKMISLKSKYSFLTGLFVILCVIGTIVINSKNHNESSIEAKNTNRILKEKKAIPFLIVKDYSKKKINQEAFLEKKHKEFLSREYDTKEMKIDVIHEENEELIQLNEEEADKIMNFETKPFNTTNNKNANQGTQVVPISFYTEKQKEIKSVLCKDFISASEQGYELFKQFFQKSQNDAMKNQKEEHYFQKTMAHSSHLRRDNEDNDDIKMEDNDNQTDEYSKNEKTSKDLIFHMIIPTESNIENKKSESNVTDSSFYEVGCKIFEINKIYK